MTTLTLHVLPPSPPCRTVQAALRFKGLDAEVVALTYGPHAEQLEEIYGAGNFTVPGMLFDDEPVHGSRAIRRPDGGFHIDMTPPLDLPRDAKGRVDVAAGTAMINRVVEGWVREHPEQWLWLHDRWKASPA